MEKHHIYVFRHGQTYFNRKGIFTGWKESKLTPLGIKQARKVARELKDKRIGIAFDNTLGRSKQTLKEVLKYHPECRKIISDKRMIEKDYGDLDGTSHKEFIKKFGEEKYNLIHRGYDIRPPHGESFADVEKRVKSFIKDLKKIVRKEKVNVAISASGNSIRLFRKIMENKPKKEVVRWTIDYDKYYEYFFPGYSTKTIIIYVNFVFFIFCMQLI